MKTCDKCGEQKTLDHFYKNARRPDGYLGHCKACHSAYGKAHYQRTKHKYRESRAAQRDLRLAATRDFICQYLSEHPCVDCGEADIVVLDFDHLGDKEFDLSMMIRQGFSITRIQAEIAKCEVRCANCHRRKTAERLGGTYRTRYAA